MEKEITETTPVAMCTVGQLADFMEYRMQRRLEREQDEWGYGLNCIMREFNCSKTYALRLKNGPLREAVDQAGRGCRFRVNLTRARKLMSEKKYRDA